MNQRIQYYGPDGEKLPVAYRSESGHLQKSIEYSDGFLLFSIDMIEPFSCFSRDDWSIRGGSILYASDFTEEELKELVDEKDF